MPAGRGRFRGGMPPGSLVCGSLAAFIDAPTLIALNGALSIALTVYILVRSHGVPEI